MIPCVTSPVLVNASVAGVAFASNREAACTASPSQWPDARDSFTIFAQAEACAVGVHGVVIPSTHAPPPNMVTRSALSKFSVLASDPKLANENPFSFGLIPESAATAVSLEVASDPPHEAKRPPTNTAAAARRVAR